MLPRVRAGFYMFRLYARELQQEREYSRGVGLALPLGSGYFSGMQDQPYNPFREILRNAELQQRPTVTIKRRGRKPARKTGHVGSAADLPSAVPESLGHMVAAPQAEPQDAAPVIQVDVLPLTIDDKRDVRRIARAYYWMGYRKEWILARLGISDALFRSWKSKGKWDNVPPIKRLEESIELRVMELVARDEKTGADYKEIDLLMRQMERSARIVEYNKTGKGAALDPEGTAARAEGSRRWHEKRKRESDATPGLKGATRISEAQAEVIAAAFDDDLFGYQRTWLEAGKQNRIRHILKSRQIGATYFFAREALIDAIETGRNQIFLSASRAQAHVFKHYMQELCSKADVELKGDVPRLQNGAHLYFLGTNSKTAQSYHGNLYFDEIFWVPNFQELRKVSSGMAIHKRWRQTYFSTPSSITHEAYPFWSGALFNRGKPESEQIEIDISHAALAEGRLCADGQWRQIVTVEDAIRGGCDLFDLEQLRLEYSSEEFANLLMCEFVDDTDSVFPFSLVSRCMVDSWDVWADDYRPFHTRPFGDKAVWLGYDPGGSGDGAGLVVVAPPDKPGGKFRILEMQRYRGMEFAKQADAIRAMCARYCVEKIDIDLTGMGQGVYELVRGFFPHVTGHQYSVDFKTKMVLKAHDVMSKGRLEFEAGAKELAAAFMAIRRQITESGRQLTYRAGRNQQTGHAEMAWATMHALINEPLQGAEQKAAGSVEVWG